MSADYAFGQFRFLTKLLIVHGRWSYQRIADMHSNSFYKVHVFGLEFCCRISTHSRTSSGLSPCFGFCPSIGQRAFYCFFERRSFFRSTPPVSMGHSFTSIHLSCSTMLCSPLSQLSLLEVRLYPFLQQLRHPRPRIYSHQVLAVHARWPLSINSSLLHYFLRLVARSGRVLEWQRH
jgi:hypothetical protein